RSVTVIREHERRRIARMHASRSGFPCIWTAEQVLYPAEQRIYFKHLRGVTRDMTVWWMITDDEAGCTARILHDLRLGWPWPVRRLGEWVISHLFIDHIAGKTLRRIKALAEQEARA